MLYEMISLEVVTAARAAHETHIAFNGKRVPLQEWEDDLRSASIED